MKNYTKNVNLHKFMKLWDITNSYRRMNMDNIFMAFIKGTFHNIRAYYTVKPWTNKLFTGTYEEWRIKFCNQANENTKNGPQIKALIREYREKHGEAK
jgi:hypothetical protein